MGTSSGASSVSSAGKDTPSLDSLDYVIGSSKSSPKPTETTNVVVFVFWATWCRESRSVISELNNISAKYKKRNVEFLGITAEAKTTVEAFQRRKIGRMNFPCAVDSSGKVARACCIQKTPTACICDGGKVMWSGDVSKGGLDKAIAVVLHERGGRRGVRDDTTKNTKGD